MPIRPKGDCLTKSKGRLTIHLFQGRRAEQTPPRVLNSSAKHGAGPHTYAEPTLEVLWAPMPGCAGGGNEALAMAEGVVPSVVVCQPILWRRCGATVHVKSVHTPDKRVPHRYVVTPGRPFGSVQRGFRGRIGPNPAEV